MYCVPYIINKLCGSINSLQAELGDEPISGVFDGSILKALNNAGYKTKDITPLKQVTVLKAARSLLS